MATSDTSSVTAQPLSVTARMLASGKYSDLTTTCQGRTFKVHRAVICLQSKPIAAMVDGNFKEAVSGIVDLPNDDADVIEKMVQFMYHGDYADGRDPSFVKAAELTQQSGSFVRRTRGGKRSSTLASASTTVTQSSPESAMALLLNARIYVIAELYDVPSLKELAKEKYAELVPTEWNNPTFVATLKLMYENTPESDRWLKDVAINAAADNVRELVDCGEFVELCKGNGEVAFNVLKASCAVNVSLAGPVYCDNCRETDFIESGVAFDETYCCSSCEFSFS